MGKRDIAEIMYYRFSNFLKRNIIFSKYKILNKAEHKLIAKNEEFRNIHKGKRCFIVGNGPSLKDQDLSLLHDEYVITVNQIARNKNFEKMNTNYHFWADPVFFDLSPDKEEDMELLKIFKGINTENNKPKCFMPTFAQGFVSKFDLDKYIDINYFNSKLHFHDNYNKDIDFTKFIPSFQTVVQWAIAFAIYAGFSEIYLLGCDTTGIITTINTALDKDNYDTYAYEISNNEKKRLQKMRKNHNIEVVFAGWTKVIHFYKELYDFCNTKKIKLVNCSAKTIIDSIPREKYESVITRKIHAKIIK